MDRLQCSQVTKSLLRLMQDIEVSLLVKKDFLLERKEDQLLGRMLIAPDQSIQCHIPSVLEKLVNSVTVIQLNLCQSPL